jgi:hypothetical protein
VAVQRGQLQELRSILAQERARGAGDSLLDLRLDRSELVALKTGSVVFIGLAENGKNRRCLFWSQ